MKREIRNAKIFIVLTLCVVVVFMLVIGGAVQRFHDRPLDSSVTVEGVMNGIENRLDTILAKINDSYYQINPTNEFSKLLQFDHWIPASATPEGEPVVSLRLAELWIAEFYSDGTAAVHNGYAIKKKYKDFACYSVPGDVLQDIVESIEQNGTPHQLGDGTISVGTFNY